MKNLDSGFTIEVDKTNKKDWSAIIQRFSDAMINQTWDIKNLKELRF